MATWQSVNKLLKTAGVGTTILVFFGALFLLSGVDYTFSGDQVCDGLECTAYINVTTTYWRICFEHTKGTQNVYIQGDKKLEKHVYGTLPDELKPIVYKKSTRGRTLWGNLNLVDNIITTFPPEIDVLWYVPARGKDNWRQIKDGDCWDRGKTNKIKLVAFPMDGQKIKWSFDLGDQVHIDPVWISYADYYKQNPIQVPIHNETPIEVPSVYIESNDSWTSGYNYSSTIFSHYETRYVDGEKLGTRAGGINYTGDTNVDGDYLYHWSAPQSDRNYEEYGTCRDFEERKGVCEGVNLLE